MYRYRHHGRQIHRSIGTSAGTDEHVANQDVPARRSDRRGIPDWCWYRDDVCVCQSVRPGFFFVSLSVGCERIERRARYLLIREGKYRELKCNIVCAVRGLLHPGRLLDEIRVAAADESARRARAEDYGRSGCCGPRQG